MGGRGRTGLGRRRPPLVGRHPLLDGPPTRKPHSGGVVAMLAVLAVVLLVWVVSGGDPGTATRSDDRYVDTATTGAGPTPGVRDGTADGSADGSAGGDVDPVSGLPVVAFADLPVEAARVVELIEAGGPFDSDRDGTTFSNFEGILPEAADGYYREYTVPTPGAEDRGARRLVEGDEGELYWTADHYASFAAVDR